MRNSELPFLAVLSVALFSCSYLRVQDVVTISAEDWTSYGGTIERTNVARSVVKPPLSLMWEYDASAGFSPYSAAVADSYLFVGNLQGELHVIDIGSGKGLGFFDFGQTIIGTPIVDGGLIYVALTRGEENLLAYRLSTGSTVWQTKLGDVEASPLLIAEHIFVTTLDGKLVCVNKTNGEKVWQYDIPRGGRSRMIRSSPASDGQIVVFGCDDGNLYAVGVEDGKLRWSAKAGGSIFASPSISGGKIFVGSLDRYFYALDASTGREIWKRFLGSTILSSQAVSQDYVYVGTTGRTVYCLDAQTGDVRWKTPTNGVVNSSPLLSGEIVYVGCLDKNLYAFNSQTGELLWKYQAEGRIKTMPIIAKHRLYLLVEDRSVLAFASVETR